MTRPRPSVPGFRGRIDLACQLLLVVLACAACVAAPDIARAQAFSFSTQYTYPTGTTPYGLSSGDMNGDGILDLVSSNYNGNSISVLLGDGHGGFANRVDTPVGNGPYTTTVGDLDGDGRPDIVVLYGSSSTVSLLFGNGAGGFGPRTDLTLDLGSVAAAIGDLNGDGRPDLVVASRDLGRISTLLGIGGGAFAAPIFSPGSADAVALGDVNGDGKLDVVTANSTVELVAVRLGDGAGGLGPQTTYPAGSMVSSVAIGDLNGDGRPDLATANRGNNTVSVLLSNGPGTFAARTDYSTAIGSDHAVVIADVNLDGIPDLTVDLLGGVSVLPGDGTGGFGTRTDVLLSTGYGLVVADLNGDGRPDIAKANQSPSTVTVVLNAAGGSYRARQDIAIALAPYSVTTGDVNSDGRTDLITASYGSNTVSVMLGTASGGLGPRTDFTTGASPNSAALADLNADGKPDLVTANGTANTVSVLLGNGAGGFGAKTDFATGTTPYGVAIADFNGDGRPDVVTANYGAGTVSVLLGNGLGGFGAKTDFTTGPNPHSIAIADFTGDGKLDLMVGTFGDGKIDLLTGNGAGSFSGPSIFTIGGSPWSLATADLNEDGKPDLVSLNISTNKVNVYASSGGGLTYIPGPTTGTSPFAIALGDINGDGHLDLAACNNGSNTVSVWYGEGNGQFGPRTDLACGAGPYGVAMGDLNGDGSLDVVSANNTPSTVSVFLSLETTRTALAATPSPAVLGSQVTLTAAVSSPAPGAGAPSDSVRFFDGTTLLGTVRVTGGIAALALSAPRLGDRALTAVYKGDGNLFGSISSVRTQRVVSTASPSITGIADVANDQGKQLRLAFGSSPFDYPGSPIPIVRYDVFRRATVGAAPLSASPSEPASVLLTGWDFVASLSAYGESGYGLVVPTVVDSNGAGTHRAAFLVRAATATPSVFYDSAPDSGYSVDNIAPVAPAPFTAAYTGGATHLHWGANTESDFWYYKLYRGASAGFVPGPSNLIATRPDTGYADPGAGGSYYKLSAVDVDGNESGFVVVTPGQTTDVSGAPVRFALERAANPSTGGRLDVAFALPGGAPAVLELLDVSGRRIAAREVGALGAGRHTIVFGSEEHLAAGLYFVRLTQGARIASTRVSVLD